MGVITLKVLLTIFILTVFSSCVSEITVTTNDRSNVPTTPVTPPSPPPPPIPYLEFELDPLTTKVNDIIAPKVTVRIVDENGNPLTDQTGNITITFNKDPSGSATLGGTLVKPLVDGVATFDDLTIDTTSFYYQLKADHATISNTAYSKIFHITAFTHLYRSIGNVATPLETSANTSFTMSITGNTLTLTGDLPNNIGVGDVVEYDTNSSSTLTGADAIAYIHGRVDARTFIVKSNLGVNPTPVALSDTWEVDRSYLTFTNAHSGVGNPRITVTPVTTTAGLNGASMIAHFAFYGDAAHPDSLQFSAYSTGGSSFDGSYVRLFAPYLKSEVGVSQRHSGVLDLTKAHFLPPVNQQYNLRYWTLKMHIEGIQFVWPSNSTTNRPALFAENITTGTDLRVDNCLFYNQGGSSGQIAMTLDSKTVTINQLFKITNNIFYDFDKGITIGGRTGGLGEGVYHIVNNTFNNVNTGIEILSADAGEHHASNNLMQNVATDGFVGTFHVDSDYNISNIPADPPGANSFDTTLVQFVNAPANNFLLNANDTFAKNAGKDTSVPGEGVRIYHSVEGTSLHGGTHSIGASSP